MGGSALNQFSLTKTSNLSSDPYSLLEPDHENPLSDKPRILSILSNLLDRIVSRNDRLVLGGINSTYGNGKLTVFHGLRAPTISIEKYLERIFKYANCSPSCFVVAYVYMDRIIYQHAELPVTSLNVHRLLVTSVMVAAKFLDDAYFNNAYYAKVGGVTTAEMNRLELEFLFRLNFRLNVTPAVFCSYCTHLERESQLSFIQDSISPHSSNSEDAYNRANLKPLVSPQSFTDDDDYGVRTPPREMESYSRQSCYSLGALTVQ